MSDIFSGLENLGFDNVNKLNLFKDPEKENPKAPTKESLISSALFDKEVKCPVCDFKFKAKSVKVNAPRTISKDSDFFIRYNVVNPYFYDVWLCPSCGYAAMKLDFPKIKSYQLPLIQQNITTKWRGKNYPEFYDENIAIERYKLALLNSVVMEGKDSTKAMICLKTAWMYRLIDDKANENIFLTRAFDGFNRAYQTEDFPIYGLQRFSLLYLLGELCRRLEKNDEALQWFSKVITNPTATQKVKDMARDMRDLIKEKYNK